MSFHFAWVSYLLGVICCRRHHAAQSVCFSNSDRLFVGCLFQFGKVFTSHCDLKIIFSSFFKHYGLYHVFVGSYISCFQLKDGYIGSYVNSYKNTTDVQNFQFQVLTESHLHLNQLTPVTFSLEQILQGNTDLPQFYFCLAPDLSLSVSYPGELLLGTTLIFLNVRSVKVCVIFFSRFPALFSRGYCVFVLHLPFIFTFFPKCRPALMLPGASKPVVVVRFCPVAFALRASNSGT